LSTNLATSPMISEPFWGFESSPAPDLRQRPMISVRFSAASAFPSAQAVVGIRAVDNRR